MFPKIIWENPQIIQINHPFWGVFLLFLVQHPYLGGYLINCNQPTIASMPANARDRKFIKAVRCKSGTNLHPRSLTASLPPKNGGWKTFAFPIGFGKVRVSFQGRAVKLRGWYCVFFGGGFFFSRQVVLLVFVDGLLGTKLDHVGTITYTNNWDNTPRIQKNIRKNSAS